MSTGTENRWQPKLILKFCYTKSSMSVFDYSASHISSYAKPLARYNVALLVANQPCEKALKDSADFLGKK